MLSVQTLCVLLAIGVLFTLWSGIGQYRSLTHGIRLVRGKVPGISGQGPGALSHFQALSAALSATVGLGNIGGVAIAVSIGGPGAVFWMWVVGFVGMALKSTEVTLSLLYRNVEDPNNPHGGTMWVCKKGYAELSPKLAPVGAVMGVLFALSLVLFGVTGGNMFQAWNVGEITRAYFGVPTWISGVVLTVLTAAVILGGIQRIGRIASVLVPVMCGAYVLGGLFVIFLNLDKVPGVFALIFRHAFAPADAGGAFLGASLGVAFIFGMKRALFSSESGLGSAPIAHSAVKTPEPVTEGVVAGLEPFIDTLVVCTMTALVILITGIWNRAPSLGWVERPALSESAPGLWTPPAMPVADLESAQLQVGDQVFIVVEREGARGKLFGEVLPASADAPTRIEWRPLRADSAPTIAEAGIFVDYPAATLTAKAFDSAWPGLGRWLVPLTVWLFALSTIITYSYYGEQGMVYLLGTRSVLPFRLLWCALILVSCLGFMRTDVQVDSLSTIALGFMLAVNLPTMLILGPRAMRAWHDYFRRLRNGDVGTQRRG
jgi:AGCS family alanine or glycine:cation symporter